MTDILYALFASIAQGQYVELLADLLGLALFWLIFLIIRWCLSDVV